jgi:hypothetical protein
MKYILFYQFVYFAVKISSAFDATSLSLYTIFSGLNSSIAKPT